MDLNEPNIAIANRISTDLKTSHESLNANSTLCNSRSTIHYTSSLTPNDASSTCANEIEKAHILHSHAQLSLLCVQINHWICLPRRQHPGQYAMQPFQVLISRHTIILDPISVRNNLEAKKAQGQTQLHIQPSYHRHD